MKNYDEEEIAELKHLHQIDAVPLYKSSSGDYSIDHGVLALYPRFRFANIGQDAVQVTASTMINGKEALARSIIHKSGNEKQDNARHERECEYLKFKLDERRLKSNKDKWAY